MHYLSYDTETTALDGYIIELGMVLYDDIGTIVTKIKWILDPCEPVSAGASRINGYGGVGGKEVGTETFAEKAEEFIDLLAIADKILVYNKPFEWRVVLREFDRAGIEVPKLLAEKYVDVLKLAREKLKLPSHKLSVVSQYLGIDDFGDFHGAAADALYCGAIYFKLKLGQFKEYSPPKTKSEIAKISDMEGASLIGKDLEKSIPSIEKKVASFSVKDSDSARIGISALLKIRRFAAEAESARKSFLAPLKDQVAKVEADFRARIMSKLSASESVLYEKLCSFYEQKHSLQLLTIDEDSSSEEEIDEFIDKSAMPITFSEGGYKVTFDYEVKITDESKVPEIFKTPDIKLIGAYVKRHGPSTTIDGVEFVAKARFK